MLFNLLAEGGETPAQQSNPTMMIIMGVILVALIGFFIWSSISNKKKRKAQEEEAEAKMKALKVGDKVKTIGGICGFIAELPNAENTFVLQTGMGDKTCYIRLDKQAIYQTAPANGYFNDIPDPVPAPAPAPVVEEKTEEKVEEVKPATSKINGEEIKEEK